MARAEHVGNHGSKFRALAGLVHRPPFLGHVMFAPQPDRREGGEGSRFDFHYEVSDRGGVSFVRVAGNLDVETAESLRDVLLARIAANQNLIMCMSGVTSLDSAGTAIILNAYAAAHERGLIVALVAVRENIKTVLDLYRLRTIIPLFEELSEAELKVSNGIGPLEEVDCPDICRH